MSQSQTITDNSGWSHEVEERWVSQTYFSILLLHEGQPSAYINCMLVGKSLRIQDFKVSETVSNPSRIMRIFRPTISMRNRGLGGKLLKYLERLARELGVTSIDGDVTQGDRAATPHLMEFYAKHGYLPEPATQNPVGGIHIVKRF